MKIFRDPVHGDIVLDQEELLLVDTPTFQRLRGIQQLGTTYLVYPSARHSRFEHSLGTLHVAKTILQRMEFFYQIRIPKEHKRLISFYALLHDISHIPFGHTLEDERRIFPRHDEDQSRLDYFLEKPDLKKALEHLGVYQTLHAILLSGKSSPPYIGEIISATIGADMMDYLRRDTYFCGLNLDYDERIFRSFSLAQDRLVFNLSKEGMLREDALSELVHLLHMRYILTERVYFHHAKTAASVMLCKAVEYAVAEGLKCEQLYELDDRAFIFFLRTQFEGNSQIQYLLERLEARQLFKRAYVLSSRVGKLKQMSLSQRFFYNEKGERERAEKELAKALSIPEHSLAIYCPSPKMASKRADMPIRTDDLLPHLVELEELEIPEVHSLLEKHRRLWRFYVFLDPEYWHLHPKLSRLCEEFFGEKNELTQKGERDRSVSSIF